MYICICILVPLTAHRMRRYDHFEGRKMSKIWSTRKTTTTGSGSWARIQDAPQNIPFGDALLKRCMKRYDHFKGRKNDQIVRFLDTVLKRCERRYGHFDGSKCDQNGVFPKTATMGSTSRRTPNRPLFGRPFEALLETIRTF